MFLFLLLRVSITLLGGPSFFTEEVSGTGTVRLSFRFVFLIYPLLAELRIYEN